MTRMTETIGGEVNFFKPMLGSAMRETYDRAQAGEILSTTEATSMFRFAMEFECIEPYRNWKHPGQYKLKGEWHDFIYYPASQVHRIDAEGFVWDLDSHVDEDSEFAE